jgi:hypothetical protein
MSDEILERSSRALRDESDQASAPSTEASLTRARILRRATGRARRSKMLVVIAPIAAVLAGSTAWASVHGRLPQVWNRVEFLLTSGGLSVESSRSTARGPTARRLMASTPAQDPVAATEVANPNSVAEPQVTNPSVEPSTARIPELRIDDLPPAPRRPSAALATTPSEIAVRPDPPTESTQSHDRPAASAAHDRAAETPPARAPFDEEPSRLYAVAHKAHFVDRDPVAALRAWDAYLAAAPDGPLSPEARYDRAITLARLGRRAEARTALEPFAQGAYGDYRAKEAKTLLNAL